MKIFNGPKPKYDAFWAELWVEWPLAFPEFKHIFPQVESEDMLSPEQRVAVGVAIKRRRKVQAIHHCKA